jgi:hypothetical protein
MNQQEFTQKFLSSKIFAKSGYRSLTKVIAEYGELQKIHTPYSLCEDILKQLSSRVELSQSQIVVLFNLEFLDVLVTRHQVPAKNICFICDSNQKEEVARQWYGIKAVCRVSYSKSGVSIMPKIKKQFDVVVMNPPYQRPINLKIKNGTIGSGTIWPKFVKMALNLIPDNGYLCCVHPPNWRGPENDLLSILTALDIHYLSMHDQKMGNQTFKVAQAYDWYILNKSPSRGATKIRNQKGEQCQIDLHGIPFIPNWSQKIINSIIAKNHEHKINLLYSASLAHTQREWMNKEQNDTFLHPCVWTMNETGIESWYSKRKDAFFQPKVILHNGRYLYPYNDYKGEYGLTQFSYGLAISSQAEGEKIISAICSKTFQDIVKATKWSAHHVDRRMFQYFRKDFWKEFI